VTPDEFQADAAEFPVFFHDGKKPWPKETAWSKSAFYAWSARMENRFEQPVNKKSRSDHHSLQEIVSAPCIAGDPYIKKMPMSN